MTGSGLAAVLSVFAFLLSAGVPPAAAADKTQDPNAVLRRTAPPGDKALIEFEKVKRINNQLAIDHFSGRIKNDPNDVNSYAKRGQAYSALKDYTKAITDYDKAIELDAKRTEAYVGRAIARMMKQDYDGSWEDVHKAESLGGEFWPAFMDALRAGSKRDQ